MKVKVGDVAPDFKLASNVRPEILLSEYNGSKSVVLYFYPKADTPGCTAQACSLRDGFAELQARGVRVVGVSADQPGPQRRFKEKHQLPFILIADHDRAVARAEVQIASSGTSKPVVRSRAARSRRV